MPWDKAILLTFGAVPPNSLENKYLGPWNKLLNALFPPTTFFTVSPQSFFPHNNPAADFIVAFEIKFKAHTVLIVEVSRPSVLDLTSTREEVDEFMRDRFGDYADMCPIPTLRGISAMGTRMAFYSLSVRDPEAETLPPYIPRTPKRSSDGAPRERWSLDVLSEEGEAEVRRIVDEIKAELAPELPKLVLHHGSSALAISQAPLAPLPKTITYPQDFTIHAPPGTDLWRKPPTVDIDNAPTLLINVPIDLHRFCSARVTISADWNTQYDQGGLALFIPDEDTKKFVKTGVEFAFGEPHVGTVAASRWGDWSLVPAPATGKTTIQVEHEVDEKGKRTSSLWIYLIDPETGKKSGIREITWWFRHDMENTTSAHVSDKERRVLLVGLYAARPKVPEGPGREQEELVVKFEGFEVTMFDDD